MFAGINVDDKPLEFIARQNGDWHNLSVTYGNELITLNSLNTRKMLELCDKFSELAQSLAIIDTPHQVIKLHGVLVAEYEINSNDDPELLELYDNTGQPLPGYMLNTREVETAIAELLREEAEDTHADYAAEDAECRRAA